jgi:8-oxo-dGTP pyrophosphatase MutT (NUDIX family)
MTAAWRLCGQDDPVLAPSKDLDVARAHVVDAVITGPDDLRQQVLDFVDAHDDALVRTCAEGHLTGSAMVVDPESRQVLLLLHAKLGRWLQPGGHADGDAALPGVALKEATEETGIEGLQVVVPAVDVDVHRVEPPNEPAHLHLDARYLVIAPPGAPPRTNHESRGFRWVDVDDLAGLGSDPGLLRLARAALKALDELSRL